MVPSSTFTLRPSLQHSAFSLQHFLLLFLALCPYFIDLGGSSIWDANEAFYVETPREMMERGDYINPTFNYEPRVNKPVLSYWIVAGFYHLFGVSVQVQRVPIAIAAMILIATAFFLARAASPSEVSTEAGGWAALGLAVSPRLVMFARRIFIDMYITMFMGLTLLFFALAERYPGRRRLFLVLMYVSVGLGMLTKGPIAALLPALTFGAYLAFHRELGRIREMLIPAGIAIIAAIVVPWYAALYRHAGWGPINSFLLGENLARYTEGLGVGADRGPWWYLPVLFSDSFPWSILLIVAAAAWFRDRRGALAADPAIRIRTLLWIWILGIVGFFSMSAGKQDLYVFPIVPAVVALGGVAIARALHIDSTGSASPGIRVSTAVIGVLLVLMGAAVLALFQTSTAVYTLDGTAFAGAVAIAAGMSALLLASGKRVSAGLAVIAAALVVVNWVFVLRVLPSFEAYKPSPRFAATLAARAGPDDAIITYNVALPSLVYYLRRHTEVFYDHGPALERLHSNRRVFLILPGHDYETIIKPAAKVQTCLVESLPTFEVKLKNFFSPQQRPELLLITNRCGS
jgi:4-amino-4-deoxy-L-arabinose transferase-like glycosyltransferase